MDYSEDFGGFVFMFVLVVVVMVMVMFVVMRVAVSSARSVGARMGVAPMCMTVGVIVIVITMYIDMIVDMVAMMLMLMPMIVSMDMHMLIATCIIQPKFRHRIPGYASQCAHSSQGITKTVLNISRKREQQRLRRTTNQRQSGSEDQDGDDTGC